ncbi:class F sortase [Geodermatophilus ruber]|uniref:Sortase family protein n=1 Tax=Geodermatophilus ruber TaxID=504800 RepID=A0A1I4IQM4_9ACTN|nr:class F sortase [Geodermatophilus ruber]SFL56604.1 Sortase family protein [Geodermatophilus ruber]
MRTAERTGRPTLLTFLLVALVGVGLVAWRYDGDPLPAAEAPAGGPVVPVRLTIPAIDVDSPVESRGTVRYENPFTGQPVDGYGVPESMDTTSWWSDGPQPGSGRMAVVLGHAGSGGPAVFDRLAELRAGDEVSLVDGAGAVLRLEVLGDPLTALDKSTSALADVLNGHPPGAAVAFVTCSGAFDEAAAASEENTVVFASLAGG